VELIEYEKENSVSTTFDVPSSSVPRIVGKQGSAITELQAVTGAQIEVDTHEDGKTATVTLKGSKEAISSAKKQIQAIAQESSDEAVIEITVPKALQPGLIGKGGAVRECFRLAFFRISSCIQSGKSWLVQVDPPTLALKAT
jgi:polyribonucleotide nucleotidyltransferase